MKRNPLLWLAAVIGLVIGLAWNIWPSATAQNPPAQPKWEYMTQQNSYVGNIPLAPNVGICNGQGATGWELCSVVTRKSVFGGQDQTIDYYIFKRQIKN